MIYIIMHIILQYCLHLTEFLQLFLYRLVVHVRKGIISSVKRKKIRTLPLKVKRHTTGLKSEIVKHDLMATTMEHYHDFGEVKCETGMVNVADRKSEDVNVNIQVDGENEQKDSIAKSSKYSNRKEKDFAAWSEIIRESLTIFCEI